MSSPDMHTLSGAYALNALSDTERARFKRHLEECPSCRQEVTELQATAARLGAAVAAEPPARLKQRVLAEISATRQLPPSTKRDERSRGGARVPRWALGLAAAAAVIGLALAGIFGGIALRTHGELTAARQHYAPVAELLAAPDVRATHAGASIGGGGTVLVSAERNRMVFMAAELPPRPSGRDYQVWLMTPGIPPRSIGLLPDSGDSNGIVLADQVAGATQVALTVEPEGGSPVPTTTPVLRISMPS